MALLGDTVQPGAYRWIRHEPGNAAERGMYADFLDEAAIILQKPALREAAKQFRQAEAAWSELANMLLPNEVTVFKEARKLLDRKRALFMEQGSDGLSEIQALNTRLRALQSEAAANFPLSDTEVVAYRERLSEQVLRTHDVERDAVKCLQDTLA